MNGKTFFIYLLHYSFYSILYINEGMYQNVDNTFFQQQDATMDQAPITPTDTQTPFSQNQFTQQNSLKQELTGPDVDQAFPNALQLPGNHVNLGPPPMRHIGIPIALSTVDSGTGSSNTL